MNGFGLSGKKMKSGKMGEHGFSFSKKGAPVVV